MSQKVNIHLSAGHNWFNVLAGLFGFAFCVMIFVTWVMVPRDIETGMGLVSIPTGIGFLFFSWHHYARQKDPSPLLSADETGFRLRKGRTYHEVSWEDVKDISFRMPKSRKVLTILLKGNLGKTVTYVSPYIELQDNIHIIQGDVSGSTKAYTAKLIELWRAAVPTSDH